jgi:uncharacterized protein (DUF58 family)
MKTTREGKRFILATVLILVAAFNTGNNLIYLILSLMLSFLFLSVLILRINLAGLEVDVSAEGPVFAGEETDLKVILRNKKRFLPCYSANVSSGNAGLSSYFLLIPPSGASGKKAAAVFKKRGLHQFQDFQAGSSFPFILFSKQIPVAVKGAFLVYPAYYELRNIEDMIFTKEEAGRLRINASGEDMLYMRKFRDGDDRKKIHWKSLAKTSALMVKEYSDYETTKITLIIDNIKPEDFDNFEKVVSVTASLARYYLDAGSLVRVMSCRDLVSFGCGYDHLLRILDMLSVVREEDDIYSLPCDSEKEGFTVSVVKSPNVTGTWSHQLSDLVIYADTL